MSQILFVYKLHFFGWYKTEEHFTRKVIFDIC